MPDLKPQIEKLVGRLAGGRGGGTARPADGSPTPLRPGDAGFAEAVALLGAMPLDEFAREGGTLEVRVPWLGETLWFAPDEGHAEALFREGVSRGSIWTARELMKFMALPEQARMALPTLALAKLMVAGELIEARRR